MYGSMESNAQVVRCIVVPMDFLPDVWIVPTWSTLVVSMTRVIHILLVDCLNTFRGLMEIAPGRDAFRFIMNPFMFNANGPSCKEFNDLDFLFRFF